jgi:hypothetical protein
MTRQRPRAGSARRGDREPARPGRVRSAEAEPAVAPPACSARTAPATPPGTAAGAHRLPADRPEPPYGGYFDELAERSARARGRRQRAARRSSGSSWTAASSPSTCAASTCWRWRTSCATTRRCASRSAPACPACTTRRDRARTARGLPPGVDHAQPAPDPARGDGHPTPTRTSRRCTSVYPATNWHERETWDFFGIIFDGHPALTRIEMPDDWPGTRSARTTRSAASRSSTSGAKIPPPDERRSYS